MTLRIARVLALVLLLSPVLFAAEDLTGKWAGSFVLTQDGQTVNQTVHMVATQKGTDLTGTVGPNADTQWTILKGKVETSKVEGKDVTKVTFDVQILEGGGEGPIAHFSLTLADGHLKGGAKAEQGGQSLNALVDMQRLK